MGGSIFLTGFFGLFFVIGFAMLGFGVWSLHMTRTAERWPTTPGEIIASDFIVDSDSDGTTYRTKVSYSYNANGVEHTGKKIAFGYSGSSSEAFHRDIYRALPSGANVAVRYDPRNPERSVLSFGINKSILFILLFGAVWTMFTGGMAAMFWLNEQGAGGLVGNIITY